MTYWTKPDFKALQKVWYQRLSREGFVDIEEMVKDDLSLKQRSDAAYKGTDELTREAKEIYYMRLCQAVYQHWFDDDIERRILTWYSHGWKIREICEDLERMGEPRARNTVRFVIRRYEIEWGLRSYKPNQMNQYPKKATP